MFYVLCFIGIVFIISGVYLKSKPVEEDKGDYFNDDLIAFAKDLEELKRRMDRIERTPIDEDYVEVEEIPQFEKVVEKSMEKFKLLREYQEKGYSIEEICTLLDMKKGEVLLLKNLYKDYQT